MRPCDAMDTCKVKKMKRSKKRPARDQREQMNVVIVGHVDHGKSTLIGRLLADTQALPEGKLDEVKRRCERNARPFEYAFLLDALKDEQSQGITIDTARCFFKSSKRDYIIIDAPGHIEFLKNMISGAARAEAAVLVIDANEGIRENSKRHGYMMSFLGIPQVAVCVNKMDLVQYDREVFDSIRDEFVRFLQEINVNPTHFMPINAREGDNVATGSGRMPWYKGASMLEALDGFRKTAPKHKLPFRLPVQDIYKFTEEGDDRRIVAGRVESGLVRAGEEVAFYPSGKRSRITSIEGFHTKTAGSVIAGQSVGLTLDTQIYVRPGEMMCRMSERQPHVSTKLKANIFWMGHQPFVKGKTYKLKVVTQQVPVILSEIISTLDASELSSIKQKKQIDRHDVAECILETMKPLVFDEVNTIRETGRFVLVDNYEIQGGGIILAPVFEEAGGVSEFIKRREYLWNTSRIPTLSRTQRYSHKSVFIILTGEMNTGKEHIAHALEESLFKEGRQVYYLGVSNELFKENVSSQDKTINKFQHIEQVGEIARIITETGQIFITSISGLDEYELKMLRSLTQPIPSFVVNIGEDRFSDHAIDLYLKENEEPSKAVSAIHPLLNQVILPDPEYTI